MSSKQSTAREVGKFVAQYVGLCLITGWSVLILIKDIRRVIRFLDANDARRS